jgi:hypothetical protein
MSALQERQARATLVDDAAPAWMTRPVPVVALAILGLMCLVALFAVVSAFGPVGLLFILGGGCVGLLK